MREDFPKLLCERPRSGYLHKSNSLRNKAAYPYTVYSSYNIFPKKNEDIDAFIEEFSDYHDDEYKFFKEERFKQFEPLKYKKGGGKYLNENLGPLVGFLINQKGRYWDDVYSEICKTIPKRGTVNLHIYQYLFGYVHIFQRDGKGKIYRIGLDGYGLTYPSERSYSRMRSTDIIIDKDGIIIPAYEYINVENKLRAAEGELKKLQNFLDKNFEGYYKEDVYDDYIERFILKYDHHKLPQIYKTVTVRVPPECFKITSEEVNREFKVEYINGSPVRTEIELPAHKRFMIPIFGNTFRNKTNKEIPLMVFTKDYYGSRIEYKGKEDSRLYSKDIKYEIKHVSSRRSLKIKNPVYIWEDSILQSKENINKLKEDFWIKYNEANSLLTDLKSEMDELLKRVVND